MSQLRVKPGALRGEGRVPGDKSISHRALILGALADGRSEVEGFLDGGDCRATASVVARLGVEVEAPRPDVRIVHGVGLAGLREPDDVLSCDNSGTTLRLLAGVLAAQPFCSVLSGSAQLRRRPMGRVVEPLRAMGARIVGREGGRLAPLAFEGGTLRGARHDLALASAQVKSCLLLAGLWASGETTVVEPGPARDHTERMLANMGAPLRVDGRAVTVAPLAAPLAPLRMRVPGDVSSAAFLLVAGAVAPGSDLTLRGVGLNPTRTGVVDALRAMGAALEVAPGTTEGGEPSGDLHVRPGALTAARFGGEHVVRMIDELPVLAVAATQAVGRTEVRDAHELRVKETDRIATTVAELRRLGATIEALPDGFVVEGLTPLRGAHVSSHGDHRLAMALAVAGLVAEGTTVVEGAECAGDSFPGFAELLRALGAEVAWA